MVRAKIYINGKLTGYCDNPEEFTKEMRDKRRNGQINNEMNITYYDDNHEIYIFTDPGRARRPL
ncbi:MAG: DNA-directed RNA polymerase subunit B, partial [Methanobrevibacter sp.]|nr:DNA-directed RNA polymerase subunit B [Methanobrevibacter sp.]